MCWSAVLLEDEEVSWHVSDHWLNLLHQQDIPVVCTICLYSGFNKEQSVQPSCETAADTMTEDRAGPQQALGTNITLLCWRRYDILSIDRLHHCEHLFICRPKPDEADSVLWKLVQKLLASFQARVLVGCCQLLWTTLFETLQLQVIMDNLNPDVLFISISLAILANRSVSLWQINKIWCQRLSNGHSLDR
jgi:hypothetical protein